MYKQPQNIHSKIKEILDAISATLRISKKLNGQNLKNDELGLFGGVSGEILYLYKFNQNFSNEIDPELFNSNVDIWLNQFASLTGDYSVCSGLAGQGWVLEFISQSQDDYDTSGCQEIDHITRLLLNQKKWLAPTEFVAGLAGIATYLGRRQKKVDMKSQFSLMLEHLEQTSISTGDDKLYWKQPAIDKLKELSIGNEHSINLGFAHGVPGIIASILAATSVPELKEQANDLLVKSCKWLLEQQVDASKYGSYFPHKTSAAKKSRIGWCYGDLPIALLLARVANALQDQNLKSEALKIAMHCSKRRRENEYIKDEGLCHGSSGIFILYRLIALEFEDSYFDQVANYWLEFVFESFDSKGLEGLFPYLEDMSEHVENSGFLMGLSGIGMALMTELDNDYGWTECLLLA